MPDIEGNMPVTTTHRVVIEDDEPVLGRGRRTAVLTIVALVAAIAVAGAGVGVLSWTNRLKAPPSCETFARAATIGGVRRGLVIKVPGNGPAAQDDVARFVRTSLAGTDATKPLTVEVRFLAGDNNYASAGCFAAPLSIQANAKDLQLLHANKAGYVAIVADQRRRAVDTIAAAAADAVAAIPRPTKPEAGLLTALQVAADLATTSREVFVLTSTDTSADDCLHADRASDPSPGGGSVGDESVQNCVNANVLHLIGADLHLDSPRSEPHTGAQQSAGDAVFEAICRYATVRKNCSS